MSLSAMLLKNHLGIFIDAEESLRGDASAGQGGELSGGVRLRSAAIGGAGDRRSVGPAASACPPGVLAAAA